MLMNRTSDYLAATAPAFAASTGQDKARRQRQNAPVQASLGIQTASFIGAAKPQSSAHPRFGDSSSFSAASFAHNNNAVVSGYYMPPPPPSPPSEVPTGPINIDGSRPHYSDIRPLLASRQVKEVRILMDPNSLSHLPVASVAMNNGTQYTLLLPHDTKAFTKELEQSQVPYTYQSTAPQGAAKVAGWAGGIVSDLVGPFLLLGGTGAISMWGYQKYNQFMETKLLREDIRNAHKKELSGNYAKLKAYHALSVQRSLDDFLHGQAPVIIAKGYPGLGKTHILSALAKASIEKSPDAMLLDVGTDVGQNVRQLLKNIYCGDRDQTRKAMQVLQQENNNRPVKEILLYADELENIPQAEIKELLIKGIGNPSSHRNLPTLRMLATCNKYPEALLNDEAVESRVKRFLIPPPSAESTADILAGALKKAMPEAHLPEPAALDKAFQKVLEEHPGYSPRTLINNIAPTLARKLNGSGQKNHDAANMSDALRNTLNMHKLNPTELAGLIGQMVVDKVMGSRQTLDAQKGPVSLWETLHDSAKNATQEAGDKVSVDGKIAKAQIAHALDKLEIDISDPGSLDSISGNVVKALKTNRLTALKSPLSPLQKTEMFFIDQFSSLIQKMIKTEERALKNEKDVSRIATEETKNRLQHLQVALRNLDRQSPAGKDLTQAAVLFHQMKQEFTEEDKPTFITKEKIEALVRRVFEFDPAKHPAEADFSLPPDENYVELFQRLHRMLSKVDESLLKHAHIPH
jgi:hypothetical protein